MNPRRKPISQPSFVQKILCKANSAKTHTDPRSYARSRWGPYAPEWNIASHSRRKRHR